VQNGVNGPNAQYWLSSSVDNGNSPAAEYNDGPAYDDGNIDFLADEFVLVSGIGGQYSDLVFTAPVDGTYAVLGSFRGDQYGIGTVVGIVANGSVVFSSSVNSEGQIVPFQTSVTLNAGGTVVFSVGPNGGLQNTGLSATIVQSPVTLFSFNDTDGASPDGTLFQATNGNFYGTTYGGGATGKGDGTVFEITPAGALKTLHTFCVDGECADGAAPYAGLVEAANGDLYGTTYFGGASASGTVYKITTGGTLTTLYSFCGKSGCEDGENPRAAVVQATNGSLYGTTYNGGTNSSGTIFKIDTGGALTTLYSFCAKSGCKDGKNPAAALIQATDGNLYGMTAAGGSHSAGTVFRFTTGSKLTTLYNFCSQSGCKDGEYPEGSLVQATNGNFYGTTNNGGASGSGTVFSINSSGILTTLYNFCSRSGCADGANPGSALIQATDGNFYGTTSGGGTNGYGTVFTISSSGTLTTLYNFCSQSGCADGENPEAGILQATNGILYGTTPGGGTGNWGTVFSVAVGLGPFVETLPTSGKVGAAIKILGTALTGATSVTFNGTSATFKVVSGSEITTTVPSGATTGTVEVFTAGGALSSNVPFQVP
jgi:uncharacterized repeat protein (TIGR03803 family)